MQLAPLPTTGFLRLPQIVGRAADTKTNTTAIPALIPVSRSTWWAGVRSGRYPQPVKLGERCTAWRVEDIRALIEATGKEVAP
ncbi:MULTISPECIES: helix-turn-helix transcriptional regulator [Xanthomonas]|jgi:predicted DNA-binding transcriptional regulator AlpA|uniref:AlpA family phage regulatory protein n=3 Tax=Xanthomonas TaxID=338 RepID=A0A2N3RI63_9XANT|nr:MULTISPECIES: AlpA family phage regulatory protein [Xanthomonas]ASW45378.1 transcriptional regulator [Xanthomonas hortorum]KOA98556.1 transcriptional regulator [Xanthomonas arboricola]KOB16806.1 transcriptional regulator [Xanthomonas arboricola]KOB35743.1 transcriptional regulator [Xanthomonas arboricola]MBF9171494.1 AlpA family phage regulatory protein [Xanthomonas campestris pv. campestris]